jgi:type IV secretory pathway VirB3-like protein
MEFVDPLTDNVGVGFTDTEMVEVPVHPAVLVPAMVYTVFVLGESVIVDVLAPVLHVYELAPLAVKLAGLPRQMELFPAILMLGL